jgi:dynein light chain 1, axonemal
MEKLRVLSLGRNCIKKVENLEGVADTLEALWISYNQIEKLVGIDKLTNLKVLYLANNKIRDWSEIDRLSSLHKLEELLLKSCPIYDEAKESGTISSYRVEVRRSSKISSNNTWKLNLDGQCKFIVSASQTKNERTRGGLSCKA